MKYLRVQYIGSCETKELTSGIFPFSFWTWCPNKDFLPLDLGPQ